MTGQDPGWDGEERRDLILDIAERASGIAAQKVAAIHRKRIVTQTFIAALIAAAAVAIPVALIANHQRARDAAANSRYNCGLLTSVGDVLHDFIRSDADLRRDQQALGDRVEVKSGLDKLFGSKVVRDLRSESKALDRNAQRHWRRDLLPRISALAKVNCATVITVNGPHGPTGSTGPTGR